MKKLIFIFLSALAYSIATAQEAPRTERTEGQIWGDQENNHPVTSKKLLPKSEYWLLKNGNTIRVNNFGVNSKLSFGGNYNSNQDWNFCDYFTYVLQVKSGSGSILSLGAVDDFYNRWYNPGEFTRVNGTKDNTSGRLHCGDWPPNHNVTSLTNLNIQSATFTINPNFVGDHVIREMYYRLRKEGKAFSGSAKIYIASQSEVAEIPVHVLEPVAFEASAKTEYCKSNSSLINTADLLVHNVTINNKKTTYFLDGTELQKWKPSDLTTGLHTLKAVKEYDNGTHETTLQIRIVDAPNVVITPITNKCADNGDVALQATPPGGTFTSQNLTIINNSKFNTNNEQAGTKLIRYLVIGNSGCTGIGTETFELFDNPTITHTVPASMCENDNAIDLSTLVTPAPDNNGGKFSSGSPALQVATFNPSVAIKGTNNVTYNYTDANKCAASKVIAISVKAKPTVNAGIDFSVCENDPSFSPVGATPGGGKYTGIGMLANQQFSASQVPITVGASATSTLTYTVTDQTTKCSASDTRIVTVNKRPTVTHVDVTYCSNAGNVKITGGNPNNGTVTGNNIIAGHINVSNLPAGSNHVANYSYTDPQTGCSNSKPFNIFIRNNVTVSAGPDIEACKGDIISLSGQQPATGGTWQESFVFSDGTVNTGQISPGNYTLTYNVTNTAGCTGSSTRKLKIHDLPNVSIFSSPANICKNADPIILDFGIPANNGVWTGGNGVEFKSGKFIFNPNTANSGLNKLKYTHTDQTTKCKNSAEISYFVKNIPSPIVQPTISVCKGSPVLNLSNFATPSSSNNQTSWTGTNINGVLFNTPNSPAGSFKAKFKETNTFNCSKTVEMVIVVNELPVVNAGPDLSVCENEGTINLSGQSPSNALWINTEVKKNQISTASINKSITLTYRFTDANNCTSSDSRVITTKAKPTASIASNLEICSNISSLQLTIGTPSGVGGKYESKGTIGSVLYPQIAGGGTHNMSYIYQDQTTKCWDTATTTFKVHLPTQITAGIDTSFCKGSNDYDLSKYTTTSPKGGLWTTKASNAILQSSLRARLMSLGDHWLLYAYTDLNKCISKDSIIVTINESLGQPTVTGKNTICHGDTLDLSAAVPGEDIDTRFRWYIQGVDSLIYEGKVNRVIGDTDQVWFVEAVNKNNCASVRKIHNLDAQNPTGSFTVNKDTVEYGGLVSFDFTGQDVVKFAWDFGDNSTSSLEDPYHYYYDTSYKNISVVITSTDNCTKTIKKDSVIFIKKNVIDVVAEGTSNNATDVFAESLLSMYPNPIRDHLTFEMVNGNLNQFKGVIYDQFGNTIKGSFQLSSNVDMSDLKTGVYILIITDIESGESTTEKIIKL